MVIHILKDGTKKTDLTGHIVKIADAPAVYELIHRMNQKRKERTA